MFERRNNLIVFSPFDIMSVIQDAGGKFGKAIDSVKIASEAITTFGAPISSLGLTSNALSHLGTGCYLGGGITEKWISELGLVSLIDRLKLLGMSAIEISRDDGNAKKDKKFQKLTYQLSQEFENVIVEIGTKFINDKFSYDYRAWSNSLDSALESSANSIVVEGGMGKVGIYDNYSRTRTLLLLYLVRRFQKSGSDKELIIETGNRRIQEYIISLLGPNVKLGNIPPYPYGGIEESLSLEGIDNFRNQTAQTYDENLLERLFEVIDIIFDLCKEHNIDPNCFFFREKYYDLDFDTEKTIKGIKVEVSELTKPKGGFIMPLNVAYILKQIGITL